MILLAGNGGSAATAAHFAIDLQKAGFRAVALGQSVPVLTAWANDEGYSEALAEEARAIAEKGSLLIVFSVSGTSANINTLITDHDGPIVQFLGSCVLGVAKACLKRWVGADRSEDAVSIISVPSLEYRPVEDVHSILCHAIIGEVLSE
jgi:D-sedoheptulose 7-phosphate isomerase